MAKAGPKGARKAPSAGSKKRKPFARKGQGAGGDGFDGAGPSAAGAPPPHHRSKLAVRATTPKGRRALAAREPKEVETLKTTLMLHGRKTSQVVKVW
jgi:hypothetical protein